MVLRELAGELREKKEIRRIGRDAAREYFREYPEKVHPELIRQAFYCGYSSEYPWSELTHRMAQLKIRCAV